MKVKTDVPGRNPESPRVETKAESTRSRVIKRKTTKRRTDMRKIATRARRNVMSEKRATSVTAAKTRRRNDTTDD